MTEEIFYEWGMIVALIQREPFDYTKWRQDLDDDLSVKKISQKAMAL